jgi:AraC-like DNA-binding protein
MQTPTQSSAAGWPLNLSSPPDLRALSFGFHGHLPRERYRLRGLWCIHLYRYSGEAVIDGEVYPVRPGYASVTPPDTDLEHVWLHTNSVHISAHFALNAETADTVFLPAVQDLGPSWEKVYTELAEAVGTYSLQPHRAEAALWGVLWRMSDTWAGGIAEPLLHPAVRQTMGSIEARLAQTLCVADLADECGLSHNHLTRLFREGVGDTVAGYIARRRMERARHLLLNTTLSIKAVAMQTGLPDLHHFNKFMRRLTGFSPRQIRNIF